MLYFEISHEEVKYLDKAIEAFPDNVILMQSKSFSGNLEIIDVIIVLTPTILSSVGVIMQNILQHKISKLEATKSQPTEISFKLKNKEDDYEIILKTSSISSIDEIENTVSKAISKIKELKGFE